MLAIPCQRFVWLWLGSTAGHNVAVLCLWLDTGNGFFPLFRIKLAGSKPLAKLAILQLPQQAKEWALEGFGHTASV